jgi:hypothetical protein
VILCFATAAATWAQFRRSDLAVAAIEWYSPVFLFFVAAIPAAMCGPILMLIRVEVESRRTNTGPWLAWSALGAAEWCQVLGLWLAGFEMQAPVLFAIGSFAHIAISVVVSFWFVSACLDRMIYKRTGSTTSRVFWLCGLLSISFIFVVVYSFVTAEALM